VRIHKCGSNGSGGEIKPKEATNEGGDGDNKKKVGKVWGENADLFLAIRLELTPENKSIKRGEPIG